jgi:hypothetical protein
MALTAELPPLLLQAEAALVAGEFAAAQEAGPRIRELLGGATVFVPPDVQARAHFIAGAAAWQAGNSARAMELWRRVWAVDPAFEVPAGAVGSVEGEDVLYALRAESAPPSFVVSGAREAGALVLWDGQRPKEPWSIGRGEHLLQVGCPDGTVLSRWMAVNGPASVAKFCKNHDKGQAWGEVLAAEAGDDDAWSSVWRGWRGLRMPEPTAALESEPPPASAVEPGPPRASAVESEPLPASAVESEPLPASAAPPPEGKPLPTCRTGAPTLDLPLADGPPEGWEFYGSMPGPAAHGGLRFVDSGSTIWSGPGEQTDGTWYARVRPDTGEAVLLARATGAAGPAVYASLGAGKVELGRYESAGRVVTRSAKWGGTAGAWHALGMRLTGGDARVTVDGRDVLSGSPGGPASGGMGVGAGAGEVDIDAVRACR